MAQKCENCPLRQKPLFQDLSPDEVRFMQKFKVGELVVDPGAPILMEGSNSPQLFTALRGMGIRYNTLQNGRRQVLSFVFPGDFIGMQAGIMGEMGHSVEATTQMTLCVFDRSGIWNLFKSHPERAFDLTWLAASEEHFLGEALSSVGQRSAIQAIAWALVRVFLRGRALGLVRNGVMPLPFRQQDLADALGLSLVHTNKTLAVLRDRQLASWSDGELQVNNLEALADIAETDTEKLPARPIL
ncbi:Crp/Fnr family transcriptional regulator [Sulfitobacter mediterraneus]|uniref:Crp/Fnr family transcriptional regulator n=1 Tax=Sulfitobacter mediterraneus TaxID=83219 RepID=UPI000EA0341E|nr:Crp/Fnr family transcriptional regulator [Sulfitobacter mediterraneus]MBM1557520.1 Crp/Fnr family transcriptional regulator [Sulfitobacter mediterraneus]MBM1569249.1 Crp/Fnr family transcriptional regulator [Sulfitobacter mediterraneus]MBM1572693.1 Crp/Fnr family transcriptional regulator [Sulfitobacter mediterraneus]MBM1576856.1 Crp/Fnr family transcriptional regulator [Sulfitobacter mediterraneus]MBM1580644.1 Crp/Fnr family transcriptional regulator [Sulfitobacter mediterraneus]